MEKLWKLADTKIAVSIYSNPRFVFETLLVVFVCFVFVSVCGSFTTYYKRRKANKSAPYLALNALKRSISCSTVDSICTNMACAGSYHDLISLPPTPSEKYNFITFDEYLQLSANQRDSVKSLRSLCNEAIERRSSAFTIKRHLEMAKEHLQLAKCCLGSGDDRQIVKVTDSLFELLERIILSSNSGKPFPFRGDMAALAAEIAELSLDVRF